MRWTSFKELVSSEQGLKAVPRIGEAWEALEKFNAEVYDEFAKGRDKKEAEKAERLAPYIEAALARRQTRPPLTDSQIDIVPASRPKNMAAG